MSTPNYDVNYDDKRFTQVNTDKAEALSELEEIYGKYNEKTGTYKGGMIGSADKYYNKQIDAVEDWEKKQTQLQNEKTDFAIEQIEQQKAQAKKDYTKEQSGAYVDWQKQSNQYGANAEAMAAQGMANTGYAESSQVSMYNTYQNRVSTAREAYNLAVMNYNNSIKEAQLQNSSVLAEIAFESLQKQLELSLQGFQYKNQLVLELANQKREINNTYYNRYQDVLKQINTENALAEEVRQYNASLAEEKRQFDILHPQKTGYQLTGGSGGGSGGKKGGKVVTTKYSSPVEFAKAYDKKGTDNSRGDQKAAQDAAKYLNELIKSGASKDKVSNEIAIALREGAITKQQAADLRKLFTPRGIQW